MKVLHTPVLFLIFNRPGLTARVFKEIRRARPEKLFIAGDGPRAHNEGKKELCRKAREVVSTIDWSCEVKTLFRDTNLGCRKAVTGAITWFFQHVEEGIILEDDCLPHPSFFPFCSAMLNRYRDEKRIMHVSGDTQLQEQVTDDSYYFSSIPIPWGWATWRRAWNLNDAGMSNYREFTGSGKIESILTNRYHRRFWLDIFDRVSRGEVDTWDFIWTFTLFHRGGLAVIPNKNLISNIGCGKNATHTKNLNQYACKALSCMETALIHPAEITVDERIVHRVCSERYTMPDSFIKACVQFCRNLVSK